MTVDSKLSKVVYQGNGMTTQFPFHFNVFKSDWLTVTISDPQGKHKIVSVPGESITISESGGTIEFYYYPNPVDNPKEKMPLPNGFSLSITRNMSFLQMISLENGGAFLAKVIENNFDIATAERQQLLEMLSRSVVLPPTSEESPLALVERIFEAEKSALESAHYSKVFAEGSVEEVVALGGDYSSKDWAVGIIGINTQGSSKYHAEESAFSAKNGEASAQNSEKFSKLSEIQANRSQAQAEFSKNSAIASQNSAEASAFSATASARSACESMENVTISDLSAQSSQTSAIASAQSANDSAASATVSTTSVSENLASAEASALSATASQQSAVESLKSADSSDLSAQSAQANAVISAQSASETEVSAMASAISASESLASANASEVSATASQQSALESQRSAVLSEENSCESLASANAGDLSAQSAQASAVASAQSASNSAASATASATSANESLASADASEASANLAEFWAVADIVENIEGSAKHWALQASQLVPDATEAIAGKAAFATQTEVLAGIVANKIVSPKTLKTALPQAFPRGTRLVFQQSAAPTGWVKEVDGKYNNASLRFTTGNVTTGGTVTFTAAFKNHTMGISIKGSVGNTTLSTSQMPGHKHIQAFSVFSEHNQGRYGLKKNAIHEPVAEVDQAFSATAPTLAPYTSTEGSSYPHTHSLSGASGSASLNLAVKYADVIIATKS